MGVRVLARCVKCGRETPSLKVNKDEICTKCENIGARVNEGDVNVPVFRLEERHFDYYLIIKHLYSKRNESEEYLNMAIAKCEEHIALSKDIARAILKGEKRYKFKSEEQQKEQMRKFVEDLNYDPAAKYKGIKLPKDFHPNIYTSPNEYEYVPGKLGEHLGYKQLCIIREKQKNYSEVIRLATQAKEEGWIGDWDVRIERAKKKLDKIGG
jgi:hypothetical protein